MGEGAAHPFVTLPDLLAPGLRVVFVGINPSSYSVARGHYFARKQNRFWPAFSRSRLSAPVRAALGRDALGPADDVRLPEHGFGFTDLVKVPSPNAASLKPADYRAWAPRLLARLAPLAPRVVCFHGAMAYRPFARHVLGIDLKTVLPGPQSAKLAGARIYLAPNPSPANAHVRLDDQVAAYDGLADFLVE
jgi:TDG/mug DNA glycosylase family protein